MKPSAPRLTAALCTSALSVALLAVAPTPAAARSAASVEPVALGQARIAKRGKRRQLKHARHRRAIKARAARQPATPVETPGVRFRGDFEAGFDPWHVQSLSYRATLLPSGAYQGTQAARFEVDPGDVEPETGSQRSEVSGPTFSEGEDLYIRDAIRVPSGNTYEGPWQIVQQLHEEDWNGSPGVAVFLDEGRTLTIGPGDSSRTFWTSRPLQENRWYDLVYRVKLSQDPSVGFVEVWLDGVPQTLEDGQTKIYAQTLQTDATYLKAGIYRSKSSTGTSIVEHDAIVVGDSYAAATS